MTKKVLVTGSREYGLVASEVMLMSEAIAAEFETRDPIILIHGDARGADFVANELGKQSPYITVVKVPADWDNLQRWEAGPRRNGHMLDLGPDVVLAFYKEGAGNRGTQNCVDQAEARGIPVKKFTSP